MKRVIEEDDVIIMNFSGIYSLERFAKDRRFKVLDCTHLQGTDCYCDLEAKKKISALLEPFPYSGIHFIDSGDYHYMTKFWTDKIERPFNLLVFDHHTDMQEPAFGPILSCGDWVKEALDCNPFLSKVILVGPPERMRETLPVEHLERVEFHPESELLEGSGWRRYLGEHRDLPLYISIDKDLLLRKSCPTNWDQGKVPLSILDEILEAVLESEHVIGIDICGECSPASDYPDRLMQASKDSEANGEILESILTASGLSCSKDS